LIHDGTALFRRDGTCDTVVTSLEERGLTWLAFMFVERVFAIQRRCGTEPEASIENARKRDERQNDA
jgi:hypothetical protein